MFMLSRWRRFVDHPRPLDLRVQGPARNTRALHVNEHEYIMQTTPSDMWDGHGSAALFRAKRFGRVPALGCLVLP